MSCAYRHAATRIATIAGIPPDLMLTAMDAARQRRVAFPDLPPDRLRTIAPLLGITPTCGNPQQVIARAQSALLILGTLHPTHPCIRRWMAVAALLGVPDDYLPVSVHPDVSATVHTQWTSPPPHPARDRTTKGLAALWQGDPIPAELMTEALRVGDWRAIVTWMAHGVWDDRFEDVCADLTDVEIGTIVRAGVMPNALVAQITRRWRSNDLPWEVVPVTIWDQVADPEIACEGRARTAAAKLVHDPTLRDERLIDAAAQHPRWAAEVLGKRHDRCDESLIAAAAQAAYAAVAVLIKRPDLRTDDRLITAVLSSSHWAAEVLGATDLCDDRLIDAAAQYPYRAAAVLGTRRDLRDPRLIAAVANGAPSDACFVLIARPDLSDDCLIAVAAEKPWCARDVLVKRTDLSDDRLIAAVATDEAYARDVLIARPDLRTDGRLLAAIARDRAMVDDVLAQAPDLRNHPILTAVLNPDESSA